VGKGGLHIIGRSATSPAGWTTSCAAARAGRGTGLLALLPLPGGRPAPDLRVRTDLPDHGEAGDGGRGADRAPLINKSVENAQKKVEAHNFDIRKHLLEYDDVMNRQRTVIYDMRRELFQSENLRDLVFEFAGELAEELAGRFSGEKTHPEEWDSRGFRRGARPVRVPPGAAGPRRGEDRPVRPRFADPGGRRGILRAKGGEYGDDAMRYLERMFLLSTVDALWKDHLLSMDHLKEGIGLRGTRRRTRSRSTSGGVRPLLRPGLPHQGGVPPAPVPGQGAAGGGARIAPVPGGGAEAGPGVPQPRRHQERRADHAEADGIEGRPERPCPCGSGKKYKKCCGQGA